MKKDQGSALTLAIKDIIGQVDWAGGETEKLVIYKASSSFSYSFYVIWDFRNPYWTFFSTLNK